MQINSQLSIEPSNTDEEVKEIVSRLINEYLNIPFNQGAVLPSLHNNSVVIFSEPIGKSNVYYLEIHIPFVSGHFRAMVTMDVIPGTVLDNGDYKKTEAVVKDVATFNAGSTKERIGLNILSFIKADFFLEGVEDNTLSVNELKLKYKDQHPSFTKEVWLASIIQQGIEIGYWEWVKTVV